MKNNLWISLLLVLLVSGCSQKEEFNNQNVAPEGRVFTTSFENNQSRTFVKDGYLSCWTADDRISLFDGNTLNLQYKFYGKTGDNGGTFLMDSKPEGTGSSLTTNYAVYPYSENVKITTDGVITVNLPSEQHYAENSFGLGDNTMVAVTQDIHDTFLNFKNVGGCLKLQLYGNDATIQTITFTGNNKEKIAGKAILTVAPDENPTVNMSDDATTSITLDCGNGVTISNEESSPTTFWMVIPPITFTKGFTITITTTDDVSFTLSTSESIKINRNKISSISAFEMILGTGTLSLPTGNTFKNKVKAFLDSNTELTKIKFIANSATISNDILVTDEDGTTAYMLANEEWLEIHTNGRKFIANQNSGHMFSWYNKLTTIDFGKNFDVCNVEDMRYMFDNCTSLSSLDLSCFNTSKVTNLSYMFGRCSNLSSLDLSSFNTENVTNMTGTFSNCSNLSSLDLSNFNTENVTDMNYMFYNCSGLTSLDLRNFNTENVKDMSWMFDGCTKLSSLDLRSFNTENVTDMHFMFNNCSSLSSLDLSSFNTENVTKMESMFRNCSSLSSLDLRNFNTENVTDMNYMFAYCSSLTSLDLKNFNTENVTDMSWMFNGCTSLTSLDLSNFIFNENPDVEYMLSCGNSVSIPVKVTEAGYNYLTTNNCHLSSGSYFVKPDGTKW